MSVCGNSQYGFIQGFGVPRNGTVTLAHIRGIEVANGKVQQVYFIRIYTFIRGKKVRKFFTFKVTTFRGKCAS